MERLLYGSPLKERLLAHSEEDLLSGCRLWQKAINRKGYGQVWFGDKVVQAHRAAYEIFVGAIPSGYHVLHSCDVPACVNPSHLFLGTNADNMKDRNRKGRTARGEANGASKLTYQEVCEIRVILRTGGDTLAEIAAKYSVGKSTISNIKHGRSWACIPISYHIGEGLET